jgi:hypothetical protein
MVYEWAVVVAVAAGAEKEGITSSVEEEKCRGRPGAIEPSVRRVQPQPGYDLWYMLMQTISGSKQRPSSQRWGQRRLINRLLFHS